MNILTLVLIFLLIIAIIIIGMVFYGWYCATLGFMYILDWNNVSTTYFEDDFREAIEFVLIDNFIEKRFGKKYNLEKTQDGFFIKKIKA